MRKTAPALLALAVATSLGAVACRDVADPDDRGEVADTDTDTGTDTGTDADTDTDADADWDGCGPADGTPDCLYLVDIDAPAGGDGLSWATAFRDVGTAIAFASAAAGSSARCQVWVAEGRYFVYVSSAEDTVQLEGNVSAYGGFDGTETECHERDVAEHPAVLDGAEEPGSDARVQHVVTGASGARIDGFTITEGRSEGDGSYGDDGGGMVNNDCDSTLVVANCTFTDNEGQHGGGVANYFSTPRFEGCLFANNAAIYGGGAAMLNGSASPRVSRCEFRGNAAYDSGGAVYNHDDSFPVFHGCVFRENTAELRGGAIWSNYGSGASFVDSLFLGNFAGENGGAIASDDSTDAFTSCTFVGNTAAVDGQGYAVTCANGCALSISNSVLAGGGHEIAGSGSGVTVSYSAVEGGWDGIGNTAADPLFDDAWRPTAGSPCIDSGDASLLPADALDLDGDGDVTEPLPLDLDGAARVVGDGLDMGAYELQPDE